ISIIMPSFKRADRINKAIESIFSQTYENWELIIIDDNSTDNTEEVIELYASKNPRIQYIKLDKNIGASEARNIGIKVSNGQYITFLDSDDEYFPSKIEDQLNLFLKSKNKDLGIVSC